MDATTQQALDTLAEIEAANERHARDFAAMFSIDAPAEALELSEQYLADLERRQS